MDSLKSASKKRKRSSSSSSSSSSNSDSDSDSSRPRLVLPVKNKDKIPVRHGGTDAVSMINVRAMVHQMHEFKRQFEQKMIKLELLLKEGFKAVSDCSIQIEKLRSDMNLPELERELNALPSTALLKDDRLDKKQFHPDASDYSDGESIDSYSSDSSDSGVEFPPEDYDDSGDDDDDDDSHEANFRYRRNKNKRFKKERHYKHPFK